MRNIARRDFLKAATAAAGAFAFPANSDAPYTPLPDYAIHAKPFYDVTVTDTFWKRKIDTNAAVTIPLEAQKLTDSGRELSGNVSKQRSCR